VLLEVVIVGGILRSVIQCLCVSIGAFATFFILFWLHIFYENYFLTIFRRNFNGLYRI
jgi:uncharacterized membrane protein